MLPRSLLLPFLALVLPLAVPARAGGEKPRPAQECLVPPRPGTVTARQPDGRRLELRLRGAGTSAWHETLDGRPVVVDRGRWVYARQDEAGRLRATRLVVGSDDPRGAGLPVDVVPTPPPLPKGSAAPTRAPGHVRGHARPGGLARQILESGGGTVANLVLALRFSDHGPSGQNRTLPGQADLDVVLNQPGGDPVLAPTGSVRDLWLENSYGAFVVDSTVVAWLDVPGTEAFYADGSYGLTSVVQDLIRDGLDAADPLVDFTQFDQDGDGRIDSITVLHSGYGAEFGGTDQYGTNAVDRIWSHKWAVSPAWTSAEGVTVSDYNVSAGLWDTMGSDPVRIGVISHELAHFLGLPDLYDTDGSSEGAGNWELMAGGAWGFDGTQRNPSHLSAWSKWKLGWLEPTPIEPGSHQLAPVELSPAAALVPCGYGVGEYLLLENRQPVGLDAMLPSSGLALWHVDEGKGSFGSNDPNDDEGWPGMPGVPLWPFNGSHYRVALLAPDDQWDLEQGVNRGDSGDLWPLGGLNLIDDATTSPSTARYQGGTRIETGNQLSSIAVDGAMNLTFRYANAERPLITTSGLPSANKNQPYFHALQHTGGIGPFTWSEWIEAPSYDVTTLPTSQYAPTGVAQGWNADDEVWYLPLPFPFPYWETVYGEVWVSSNGFLDFVPVEDAEPFHDSDGLPFSLRVAPLWTDLVTDEPGDDVFVDTSLADWVTIRWVAHTYSSLSPCEFAATLFDDGRIRFDYGPGNSLGSPATVGIGRGHSHDGELVPGYDGSVGFGNVESVLLELRGSRLPEGLRLTPDGAVQGVPLEVGTQTLEVLVSDEVRNCDRRSLELAVEPANVLREVEPTRPAGP